MIATGQTLHVDRAHLTGVTGSRTLLAAALAQVPLAGLGLGAEELLLIPRHRSRAVLRPSADGGVEPGFGRILHAEFAATLAAAAIDPLPGTSAVAYRFTSHGAFALWLLGEWLRGGGRGDVDAGAALAAQLPGGSALGWARREVFGNGRELPMIFASLARQGLAAALLARLDPADVVQMRKALWHSHALPLAEQATAVRVDPDLAAADLQLPAPGPTLAPTPTASLHTVRAVAATAAVARAAGNDLASLPAAAVALLLVLLHLQADPATPRTELVAAAAAGPSITSDPGVASDAPAPPATSVVPAWGITNTADPADTVAAFAAGPSVTGDPADAPAPPVPPVAATASSATNTAGTAAKVTQSPTIPPSPSPAASAPNPPAFVSQPKAEATAAATAAVPLSGFASDFAGLFFLFNAFLAMGLYGDFTRPAAGVLALAPSRLLDRLALRWFGSRYRGDRLHKALARDGADPPLPDRWQVEPAWLEAFAGEEETELVTSRRHQTLWHPAGFPLADAPLPRRKGRHTAVQPARQLPSAQPARWLACLALYLDARIQRATDDPALGLSSLAIPGHCRISPERIDVDLALVDLPLPLRLAGLDRDPGWLPAEGRCIAFHFQ